MAIVASVVVYGLIFRRELSELGTRRAVPDVEVPEEDDASPGLVLLPVPAWITIVHVVFMGWTVFTSHYPALFLGGFLIFLGFVRATAPYQSRVELKAPLLVGFFLAGLVIHGGLQAWWIAPVLASLSETPLFATATILTAFNDNALITYLSTLVPNLSDGMKTAVMEGAVTGGGLTVIANAPNPAGQAHPGPLLRRRGVADLAAGRRAAADADGRDRVQDPAVMRFRDYERRDRLDRHRQRGHRDRAAGAGLSRRRRRTGAGLGRLAAVRQRLLQQRQRDRDRARVRGDPPGPPGHPPALDVHGAGRVRRLPRVVRDLSRAARRLALPRAGRGPPDLLRDPALPHPAVRGRAAAGAVDVLPVALGPLRQPSARGPVDVPDLAVRLGHRRRGLRDAADLRIPCGPPDAPAAAGLSAACPDRGRSSGAAPSSTRRPSAATG